MKKTTIMALLLALIVLLAACTGKNETSETETASESAASSEDSTPSIAGNYTNENTEGIRSDVLTLQDDGKYTREIILPMDDIGEKVSMRSNVTGTYREDEGRYWAKIESMTYTVVGLETIDSEVIEALLDALQEMGDEETYGVYVKLYSGETIDGEELLGESMALMKLMENEIVLNTEAKTFREIEAE